MLNVELTIVQISLTTVLARVNLAVFFLPFAYNETLPTTVYQLFNRDIFLPKRTKQENEGESKGAKQ